MKKTAIGLFISLVATAGQASATDAATRLKHIFIIMQENRSFDNYFGAYSGANGSSGKNISANSYKCPGAGGSGSNYAPGYATTTVESDFPHGYSNSNAERTVGSNGYLKPENFLDNACSVSTTTLSQVMAYHNGAAAQDDVYNYWQLAKNFVLQDHMFEPVGSYSKLSHLFMISAWGANCDNSTPPVYYCVSKPDDTNPVTMPDGSGPYYLWQDITSLLKSKNVSWGYYKGDKWDYKCGTCSSSPASCFTDSSTAYEDLWVPIKYFKTVADNGQTGNIQSLKGLLQRIAGHIPGHSPNDPVSRPLS